MLKIPQSLILYSFKRNKSFEDKNCPFCGSKQVKKNGLRKECQRYKCNGCGKRFDGGKRLNPNELWYAYTIGKQTAQQLANKYKCSRKTILRQLNKATFNTQYAVPSKANIIMDTTYFGRAFGMMVLYDSLSGQPLFVEEVKAETNALYAEALQELRGRGIEIQSIICDGRRGLLTLCPDIPTQLCQFHQVKTVTKYLTRRPKTEAGKALRKLVLTMKDSKKAAFQTALNEWFEQYKDFLNERSVHEETGKSHYTHKPLRSAYFSLERNMDYLFVFEEYPGLNIHKTTNLLDGRFADLKRRLACHHGMNKANKIRFIKDYFANLKGK